MRTWLKRMVAGIVSASTLMGGGLLMAGTANADEIRMPDIGKTITSTARPIAGKSGSLPTELVNGSFSYKGRQCLDTARKAAGNDYQSDWNFANIDYVKGDAGAARKWAHIDGFQASGFGWKSNQTDAAVDGRAPIAEIQQSGDGSNYYGEITASQANTYLYQDINTRHDSGTVYTVKLKHASRTLAMGVDSLQVLVGTPGHERPVELTRIASDGKDQVGEKSNVVASAVSGWNGKWDTYMGSVIIPANQPVTRFTFKSITGIDNVAGNLIDDVRFAYAYPLSYDANGGTKQQASQISSKTFGKASETDGKTKTMQDASGLPANAVPAADAGQEKLTNGDFEYPGARSLHMDHSMNWSAVERKSGERFDLNACKWVKLDGFDANRFGWDSSETDGPSVGAPNQRRANEVELQLDRNDNIYAELAANQAGTSIRQTIRTVKDVAYTVSLKHASLTDEYVDRMRVVMIAADGTRTVVPMTRTVSNGHGDKVGEKSEVIATKVTNTDARDHAKQWETYTGTYIATGGSTTFTFESVDSRQANLGNLLDDVSFKTAYKLDYDGNDGKGRVPSSSKADSTQPAAFKAPAARTEAIASRAAGDELAVNGGFDTPKWSIAKEGQGLPWVYVKPNAGTIRSYAQAMAGQTGVKAGGLTAATFAWQDVDATGGNQNFELHRERDGNTAADVHAGRTVAQTVATTPGAAYTFGIRHSGRSKGNAGGVTLLVGPDKDHLTPVRLTRTSVSKTGAKYGDRIGGVGTVAYTHSDSMDATEGSHDPWDHSDDWESYEGTVVIPAGQTKTMIAYKGVGRDGSDARADSIIDDLSFRLAYKLDYDSNGGKGSVPSHTEAGKVETVSSTSTSSVRTIADTTGSTDGETAPGVLTDTTVNAGDGSRQRTIMRADGSVRVETVADTGIVSGCQVYYPAGARITLATAKIDSDCWDSSQISKTNRTFYGWSANTDSNDRDVPVADTMDRNTLNANARTEIVMPARAKTVYALWAVNPTLSYNVNTPAGSNAPGTPASRTVPYNTAASDTSGWTTGDTGKIPGYRFDGWYTAPNGGGRYDFNTPFTDNVTVYAHWIGNGYTVRFTGNGATGGNTPDQAFQYNIGQNLRRNGFTRDGYTFTGWKRADNQQAYGDGQWVTNLTTQPDGIVTMVAQWSANEAHIRYNPNPPAGKTAGGNGTPNWDGHTGDTPAIGGNGWTIDGYTFAGWTTSPDGGGTKYSPGASWTANGTLTLYAQWTPGEAGLTYDGNGATGGKTDPQNGVTDQKVNVRQNGFTRDGYTFVRWDTQADCRGNAVNPGDKWTLQGSSTLYACWTGNMQPLTYHGNGATGGNTAAQSGKTGDELTTNANGFTRDGYTFVRWDTAKDGSGTAYGEGKNGVGRYTMKPTGNDLYAIWQANPASIQYRDDYGATGSTPDTTGVTGQNVTIARNGFTRPGYTFTGWARDRRTDPSLQPGGRYTLTPGTTTLWAQWKADPAHLIYNSNSGSTSQTRRTDGVVDQTVTVIANPFTRSGYTFTGWNTQADGRGKAYAAGNGFRLVADAKSNPVNTSVLHAQWRINRVALKFDPNGGTGGYPDITVDAFTTVTIPADAKEPKVQRPGFRFTGWAMKPAPGAGDTILGPGKGTVTMPDQGSITVYAQWAPAMTTLPFTGGHAQVPTIGLYAGLVFMILAMGALMPVIRLRMGDGSKGRHAGTPTIGRHSR
ncbi:InlB B-repeat-containing protein [Bifidobacterium longum]|uniref:Surface protein n=1 Tax=Bifidobacterium longum subsp. longum TaxID=1679 RepID=A0A4R0SW09_BIFLL|nr:InlB B-repeat-containing protein [Bifidobacterium longum]TCD85858.1 surface protein [Bifidobacterium longum subsp. longum]TCE19781.1 surface protein [Bifidobacterium longum subsp. longum]